MPKNYSLVRTNRGNRLTIGTPSYTIDPIGMPNESVQEFPLNAPEFNSFVI
jgi:hypothetical protein